MIKNDLRMFQPANLLQWISSDLVCASMS